MLFERITSVRAGAVSKKLSSDFDRTTDTLVLSASDQIDTEGVPVIDWMMLGDFMSRAGLTQRGWRPNIGNQGGLHVVDGFTIFSVLATRPKNRDHNRFEPYCGTIRQPIRAPPFRGLEHFNFGGALHRVDQIIAHSSLQPRSVWRGSLIARPLKIDERLIRQSGLAATATVGRSQARCEHGPATAIRAAIKAYSIAVTPLVSNQPEQCPAFTIVVYLAQ